MMLGIREQLLSLSRIHKRVFMVAFDALAIPFALWSAFYIRLDELLSPEFVSVFTFLPLFIISSLFVFMRLGLYHAITRFIGVEAIRAVLIGVSISTIILLLLVFLYRSEGFPRSVLFIYWLLAVIYVGGTRYLIRQFLNPMPRSVKGRAIIYGAGQAGHQLSMILNHSDDIQPTCFVDDNESLRNNYVNGLKVYSPSEIPGLIENYNIERILLAIPSASKSQIRKILNKLQKYRLHVYTVPSVEDIASGRASVNDIREINIADLLGREIVNPNMKLLHACIENKVVLVTGAGGSIGSELCRQIIDLRARQLILVDSSEFALYQIERELSHKILSDDNYVRILPLLCNVRDRSRLTQIVEGYGVNTIYHAAAYKHVPLVECNIEEGVQNNIFGTLNAAQVAVDSSVETFVLISTDKAVRPTNVMGATKRYAEMILQAMAVEQSVTRFCMVRFGNVLGSSGSVVPAFQKQIREGGPITVTHPDIVRYFMTIPEAAQLVIQAGSMGQGGDVFVLDMGEPVKIDDLARNMVSLAGLVVKDKNEPEGDIEINYTGLRPGEKLFEELLIGDNVEGTEHTMIMRAEEDYLPLSVLEQHIEKLKILADQGNTDELVINLKKVVTGYLPEKQVVTRNKLLPNIEIDSIH